MRLQWFIRSDSRHQGLERRNHPDANTISSGAPSGISGLDGGGHR